MKVTLDIFEGDSTLNAFMHASDVFEKGKQLAEASQLEFDIEVDGEPDMDKIIENVKTVYETNKRNVIFLSIREVDGKKVNHYPLYLKAGVQSISDGHKFGLFKDWLEHIGYETRTNEFMVVEEAKLIL